MPVQVLGLSSGVTDITVGANYYTCAIHNGTAKCWGNNTYGQLGNNTTTNSSIPIQVSDLSSGVTDISAGAYTYTCAIHNGAIKCWGDNRYGQLGNGSTTNSLVPIQVSGLSSGVTDIAVGGRHVCAIHNGAAKCWGSNYYGQLGGNIPANATQRVFRDLRALEYRIRYSSEYSIPEPVQVIGLTSEVTDISVGGRHTCAIHNGVIKCWGIDRLGELGKEPGLRQNYTIESTTRFGFTRYYHTVFIPYSSIPVIANGLPSGIVTGMSSSKACTSFQLCRMNNAAIIDGSIKLWSRYSTSTVFGRPISRAAVHGSFYSTVLDPIYEEVPGLNDQSITDISLSGNYICTVANNQLYCWGQNTNGQLGLGHTQDTTAPTDPIDFSASFGSGGASGQHGPPEPMRIILSD